MTASEIELRDGTFLGPLRQSVNNAREAAGSIHDDATATKLGFRGGTVAGSIHMELFPPVLVRAFGPRWFERGTLSLYFVQATTDRESVRAGVAAPPPGAADAQVDAWVERDDGAQIAEGTASVGDPDAKTALAARDLGRFESGELRILGGLRPGDALGPHPARIDRDEQEARRKLTTEPLDWYFGESPWGGPIATPATAVSLLYRDAAREIGARAGSAGRAVGLFGAIELANVAGPLRVDREYRVHGSVVAVGQSPKTEYVWFDTAADDEDGRRIAGMRMLLRFMKASSPLYAQP